MPIVSKTVEVSAPAAQILGIVADFEAYPQWNEEVTGCWILHRYDDGRPSQLRLDTKIQGMDGSYIQAVYYPGDGQIQTVMSMVVLLNHAYFGYYASGGAVGVGEAVGRSMRTSLISNVVVVLLFSLALYGTDPNFNLTV